MFLKVIVRALILVTNLIVTVFAFVVSIVDIFQ